MPTAPKKIKRSWVKETKPFEREQDNSWFYNSWAWRKFTKQFKQRHPLCEMKCKDEGIVSETKVVDHLERYSPTAKGWDLKDLQDKYYQAGCHKCHNSRSGKQGHGYKGK